LLAGSIGEVVAPAFTAPGLVYSMGWHEWVQWVGMLVAPNVFMRCLSTSARHHCGVALCSIRCSDCDYSLEGLSQGVCPECGGSLAKVGVAPVGRTLIGRNRWLLGSSAAVCGLVLVHWLAAGTYVPNVLFRVLPDRMLHPDNRVHGGWFNRRYQLGIGTWHWVMPMREAHDFSRYGVLVRLDAIEEPGDDDGPLRVRVRCVFGNPDRVSDRWRRSGWMGAQPAVEEYLESNTMYAWQGTVTEGTTSQLWIGRHLVTASIERTGSDTRWAFVVFKSHRGLYNMGMGREGPPYSPVSAVFDVVDWTVFEKVAGPDGECPEPRRLDEMPVMRKGR
jgi:hypothetical protein